MTEEITRISSHLKQWQKELKSEKVTAGKKLEFLAQELLREINTIAAKAYDVEISRSAIDFKAELEKIREQIQNVE